MIVPDLASILSRFCRFRLMALVTPGKPGDSCYVIAFRNADGRRFFGAADDTARVPRRAKRSAVEEPIVATRESLLL
jgi:hypothetical protein